MPAAATRLPAAGEAVIGEHRSEEHGAEEEGVDAAELIPDSKRDAGDDPEVAIHACARVHHTKAVNTHAKK